MLQALYKLQNRFIYVKYRYIDFAVVKSAASMTKALEHYGVLTEMRSIRNGDGLEGRCPIHKGTSADQFKVSISKNCWNCFGECHQGGNVLDFVARMEQVPIREAAHKLNDWFNLGLVRHDRSPLQKASAGPGKRKGFGSRKDDAEPAGPLPAPAHKPDEKEEHEILEESGENTPLSFELRNLDFAHPYSKERDISPEAIQTFGLGYCTKGTMSGRVVIPIHNRKSQLVGYAGRWPGEPPQERPKYKLPAGFKKSVEVFNLHRAAQEDDDRSLIVVEGFFDAIHLWQCGFRAVVALMGSSLSVTQKELLIAASKGRPGIVLMLDEDDAGRRGRENALAALVTQTFVRVVSLPWEGGQPDQFSREELEELLSLYAPIS